MTTVHSLERSRQSSIREWLNVVAPHAAYISFTKGSVDGPLDIAPRCGMAGHSDLDDLPPTH